MVSSAIWKENARVSFSKTIKATRVEGHSAHRINSSVAQWTTCIIDQIFDPAKNLKFPKRSECNMQVVNLLYVRF